MKKYTCFGIFVIFLLVSSLVPAASAASVSINTEKQIYSYGDFLSFIIKISEITEQFATLHIIDESGKKSSAIPIPIQQLETVVPSPYPFESTVYPLGKYTLSIEYSGTTSTTEFELIDSGNVVIPFWIRDFAKYWYNDAITDKEFAQGIEFLIKENIIVVSESQSQDATNEVKIPSWVKTSTGWWILGEISDSEYAKSIEYLIKVGIIVI